MQERRLRIAAITPAAANADLFDDRLSLLGLESDVSGIFSTLIVRTSATNLYPFPGTVTINRCAPGFSPKTWRRTEMFLLRLFSSTIVSGHIADINSSFSSTLPLWLTRYKSVSKTFGVSAIISSSRKSNLFPESTQKASNL